MKPQKLKRVVIKEELVELTGDFVKALILNQFIYWSERTKDFDLFLAEERKRAVGSSIEIEPTNGWVYKSVDELSEELMLTISPKTIRRRLIELVGMGYLGQRKNPIYKWDQTLQYRPDIVKIQTDLQKKGFALESYPLVVVSTPKDKLSNGIVVVSNRSAADVPAIPKTTTETTTETHARSSKNKPKKKPKQTQAIKDTIQLFVQATGWTVPTSKAERQKWVEGIAEHLAEPMFQGKLIYLYKQAWKEYKPLKESGELNIVRPASFTSKMYDIVQRNGTPTYQVEKSILLNRLQQASLIELKQTGDSMTYVWTEQAEKESSECVSGKMVRKVPETMVVEYA